jgi:drug/metabolite transporter (DMT)-like permease
MKTVCLTLLALLAFAGNSVLCRLALQDGQIDAASFTIIRLLSGTAVLWFLLLVNRRQGVMRSNVSSNADVFSYRSMLHMPQLWLAPLVLFLYAALFSFAYLLLDTGVGALLLFGAVQITMIGMAVYKGKRLHWQEWSGAILAFSGLVYLILPSLGEHTTESISLLGAGMMAIAGVAWGLYSIQGRGSDKPLEDTAKNFLKTLPLVMLLLIAVLFTRAHISLNGLWLALASGVITSGLGYAIWYSALKGLSSVQAAVVQLFVPVLAALGGLIFASEAITLHIMIAGVMVIVGVLWVTFSGQKSS